LHIGLHDLAFEHDERVVERFGLCLGFRARLLYRTADPTK
jgi:hypothetical protein